MKLIHCADLHLDSRLNTHLGREQAKRRRDELLRNFERLAGYAEENGVEAVLIAGDLFDRDMVSALARSTVLSVIAAHPQIRFYYLRGNHDKGDYTDSSRPRNLFLFGNRWKSWQEGADGRIMITGIELTRENLSHALSALRLEPGLFNIVMLHGQETGGTAAAASSHSAYAVPISIRALQGKGIDYLALGHVHSYKYAKLDSRGVYCYPGCLEGRGFDESGPHGFVLLDIDEKKLRFSARFVPFARRTLYAVDVDVTGCRSTAQINDLIRDALQSKACTEKDMVDITIRWRRAAFLPDSTMRRLSGSTRKTISTTNPCAGSSSAWSWQTIPFLRRKKQKSSAADSRQWTEKNFEDRLLEKRKET